MPFSSVIRETEEVLEEVLRTVRKEYEGQNSVLCETDRNRFVEEEESLRERFKQTLESETRDSWRSLLCLPSSQAVKCLKDAKQLRQHVKDDIDAKVRTKVTGRSNPSLYLMGSRTPETDVGRPVARAERANTTTTSPLNMDGSLPEISELNVNPAGQNNNDYTPDLNEAINTPLETSSDRSRDPPRRQRRSPPPPPPLRRTAQWSNSQLLSEATSNPGSSSSIRRSNSGRRPAPPPPQSPRQSRTPHSPLRDSFPSPGSLPPNLAMVSPQPPLQRTSQSSNSQVLSETASNSGSGSARRSNSGRRPAPPPPQSPRQSGTPRSPIHGSFPSPSSLPPNLAMISEFISQVDKLASSIVRENLSRQSQGLRCSEDSVTINHLNFDRSSGDGVTANSGGFNNTGAVIHKTT